MDKTSFLDWWPVWTQTLAWIVVAAIAWAKLMERVNGQGGRIKKVEDGQSEGKGRMDAFEKQLAEYRADSRASAQQSARTEKAVEDLKGEIQNNHLALGTQLHGIERLIQDKDKSTSNRLVRIETLQAVEKKVGPIPED